MSLDGATLKALYYIGAQALQSLSTVPNPDYRLEQAEFHEGDKTFEIVMSYLVENTNKRIIPTTSPFSNALGTEFSYYRIYKKIKINEKMEVVGVYIFKE